MAALVSGVRLRRSAGFLRILCLSLAISSMVVLSVSSSYSSSVLYLPVMRGGRGAVLMGVDGIGHGKARRNECNGVRR